MSGELPSAGSSLVIGAALSSPRITFSELKPLGRHFASFLPIIAKPPQ